MIKARLLLGLVAILSSVAFGVSWVTSNPNSGFLHAGGLVFSPIFFTTSLFMLIFSFFRVSEGSDGQLVYDPDNFYWKMLRRFYKKDWKDSVSLCMAFWKTVVFVGYIMLCMTFTLAISFLFCVFIHLIYLALTGNLNLGPIVWSPKLVGIFLSGSALIVATLMTNFISPRHKRVGYIAVALVVFALVLVPVYVVGFMAWFTFIGAFAGMIAGTALIMGIALCIAYFSRSISVSDSLAGRFFSATKKRFCPILVAKSS